MNEKINFDAYNDHLIRQTQMLLPSIPLSSEKYSDTGVRFRLNTYDRVDHWLPFTFKEPTAGFYDAL